MEFLVGCASGTLYCTIFSDNQLKTRTIQECHTSIISAVAFDNTSTNFSNPTANHFFVTGSVLGGLRAWDIIDYQCIGISQTPKNGSVLALKFLDSSSVLVSTENGSVRCVDFPSLNTTKWYIATAHRNGTTCLDVTMTKEISYLVTGGNDSTVRVWKLSNRELITEYSDHMKGVTQVLVDVKSPNVIHSCGLDGQVVSFNLKTNKRICNHLINNGSLINMTQRFDPKSEIEIVTCDSTVSD